VIEPLLSFKGECEELAEKLACLENAIIEESSHNRISWLENMYTMESERQVMHEILAGNKNVR
jgi:hypothetical protein